MPIDRRAVLSLFVAAGALGADRAGATAMRRTTPAEGGVSRRTAYGFSFDALEGPKQQLADYAGHPILVVNTASLCAYTPQYAGLQELWTRFHARGLMIIGVPSNDFGAQEPGGVADIKETAQHQYGVTFPITAKTAVRGPNAHPFYKWAAAERPQDVPHWNFHKYLIGRDGYLAEVFPTETEPTDTRVITAIARRLDDAPQPPAQRS
jgi:glutathione peroxidase